MIKTKHRKKESKEINEVEKEEKKYIKRYMEGTKRKKLYQKKET